VRLNPRNIERIVEFGAGWMPLLDSEDELWEGLSQLRAAFAAAGRDPSELGLRATPQAVSDDDGRIDLPGTLACLPELRERGATVASFALPVYARSREQIRPFLEALGRAER
jgi:hypothetical protein